MQDKRSVSYSHQNHLHLFNRTASFSSSVSSELPWVGLLGPLSPKAERFCLDRGRL